MVQVATVDQASQAAERGADVISAQGSESGGYCGEVSTMTLVPQVVDAVAPIPVVASGGIFDGHGIAAALVLGAAGVNLGTRFIASKEAPTPQEWKEAIVNARSEHAIKAEVVNDIMPLPGAAGYTTVLRSLSTEFLREWSSKRDDARRERDRLRGEIVSANAGRSAGRMPVARRRRQGNPRGQRRRSAKPARYRHHGRSSRAGQPRRLADHSQTALPTARNKIESSGAKSR